MGLIQRTVVRSFCSYIKVSRPSSFRAVKKPTDEKLSVSKILELKIKATGPITVADYMRTVLTNPRIGYYMQKDMIGCQGDFITSPEISQLFSDIIAVWICNEYRKMGMPKPWQLIELGPGRGTLMKNILKVLNHLQIIEDLSVHLVEVSQGLATVQSQNLGDSNIGIGMVPQRSKEEPHYKKGTTPYGIPVYWYEKLEAVPKAFSVILAHEFFDALPIHKFQKVSDGYREVLINCIQTENEKVKFEYVLSSKETVMSKLFIKSSETREHFEVCPEAGAIAKLAADRLEEFGGFGLFIDYGHNGEKTDTFRAFYKHRLHDPLVNPGTADLTADVDFLFLKEIMEEKMLVYGPEEQGIFLQRLGIDVRLEMLLKNTEEEVAKNLKSGYHIITDKDKMGSRYKFFAVFPKVLSEYINKYPVSGFC